MKPFEKIEHEFQNLEDVITTKQLAKLTGLSPYTIRKLYHQGIIKKLTSSSTNKFLFDKHKSVEAIYVKEQAYYKYIKYLHELFYKAYKTNSIETLFAILEVDSIYNGHWNPTEELFRFFDDFNHLLHDAHRNKNYPLRKYRLALLMYCHILEMSFPQKLLMNLLRIINNDRYIIDPFSHSNRKPPSLTWKINEITKLSHELNEIDLPNFIEEFYNDDFRNSFYHSDYCLTMEDYRYRTKLELKGLGSANTRHTLHPLIDIPMTDLSVLITKCFAFFEALFHSFKYIKKQLANIAKFHKLPEYEVLELLSKDKELNGFNIHFSNGTKATFIREPESVTAINILFEQDGTVNFMVGNLNRLTKEWKINGHIYQ